MANAAPLDAATIQAYQTAIQGQSASQIAQQAAQLGLTADQVGQVLGMTGAQVTANGYNAATGAVNQAVSNNTYQSPGNFTVNPLTAAQVAADQKAITGMTASQIASLASSGKYSPAQIAEITGITPQQQIDNGYNAATGSVNSNVANNTFASSGLFNVVGGASGLTDTTGTKTPGTPGNNGTIVGNSLANGPSAAEVAMQKQLAALQASYDALMKKNSQASTATKPITTLAQPGVVDNSGVNASTTIAAPPVYGPDGSMYASAAAARAAGVYNYTNAKPAVSSSNTAASPTAMNNPAQGLQTNAAPGLIQGASGSTGNFFSNPAQVYLPPGVHQ